MSYAGDWRLGETHYFHFDTTVGGVPTTLAGSPSLAAYPTNSTTEITAGLTLVVDVDSSTGLHSVTVVATSGNGYATGTDYTVVLAGTPTVGGLSVLKRKVGSFSIENRSALMPTVGGRTADVTATGAVGIDWNNIENPTTAVNLSGTNIDVDQVVASVSGNVTGSIGSLATQAKADVEAEALDALNTILADSIPADGTLPTVRQALYMLTQFMLERSVSSTTVTVKKADGSTSLFTLTLNDATSPTSITRAS